MAEVLASGRLPEEASPFTPRRFGAAVLMEQPA
jgi:glycine oxidase